MNRKAFQTCAATLGLALGLLAGPALAQNPPTTAVPLTNPGDWPNLGSYNNRLGQNGDPNLYGSGITEVRWQTNNQLGDLLNLFLDNTSFNRNSTATDAATRATIANSFPGAPYDDPFFGEVAVPVPAYNAWPGVADGGDTGAIVPARRLTTTNGPIDSSGRSPAYNYTYATPSAKGSGDPTEAEDNTNRKIWEWDFTPLAGNRNYAVYVNIPVGGTTIGTTLTYPQRYFVYEIDFGANGRYIDVVDTTATGGTNVRLGGRGNTTVFPFDGVNPIRVKLYNTIPRDANGLLLIQGATSTNEATISANRLVYADAVFAVPQPGTFLASPTAATWIANPTTDTLGRDWQVTAALNSFVVGTVNGELTQTSNATITSYAANPARWKNQFTPLALWNYSLVNESANGTNVDVPTNVAGFDPRDVNNGPPLSPSNGNPRYIGTGYFDAPVNPTTTNGTPSSATATVTYAPTLDDGSYALYVYLGGDATGANKYTKHARYLIYSGATIIQTVVLDQSGPTGWVRLGTGLYDNDSVNAKLSVVLTDSTANTTDTGLRVYADAVRFVAPTSIGVSSSPVNAEVGIRKTLNGPLVPTKVVIVADEAGRIHCLDFRGNRDSTDNATGTTTEYWSYPTTPFPGDTTTPDPNLVEGIDGTINPAVTPVTNNVPTATMPTGFDLSTAAIANVGGKDLLYIASTNGRVYCIDMAGRGDFNAATRRVGTTSRQWTFPDDYDPSSPATPISGSTLGSTRGSIVFGDTAQGAPQPTVYVPTRQGRIYALDALGSTTSRKTTTLWTFPQVTSPTIAPIDMTPTLQFNKLYFGTRRNPTTNGPGTFYALDVTLPNNTSDADRETWHFDGTTTPATTYPGNKAGSDITGYVDGDVSLGRVVVGNFRTGPVGISAIELNKNTTITTHVDTIYALNDNLFLYGFNALTGKIVDDGATPAAHRYETDELQTLSDGNLTYTVTQEYDTSGADTIGTRTSYPVIVIPGQAGNLYRVFARPEDINVFEAHEAFTTPNLGTGLRSAAAANGTLFTANAEGTLFALDNVGLGGLNQPFPDQSGGRGGVSPNDPRGRRFRNPKIKLVKESAYLALKTRSATVNSEGSLEYDDAVSAANERTRPAGSPYAFEWGETVYVLVYNFPYATTNQSGDAVEPPKVNITLAVEGKASPTRPVTAWKFKNGTGPSIPEGATTYTNDGYAVYPFTFNSAGSQALPPGNGTISATITTYSLSTGAGGTSSTVSADPRLANGSRVRFLMANPLALVVESDPTTRTQSGIATALDGGLLTGTSNAYDPANRVNGSPDTSAGLTSRLLASAGFGQHGGVATARAYVIDRSLMAFVRPEGIANVRVSRTVLGLQGGVLGLFRTLDLGIYPGFEDRPVNFPNNSLDYPDIGAEQVGAVMTSTDGSSNPLLANVGLNVPLSKNPAFLNQPLSKTTKGDGAGDDNARLPQRTPLNMPIEIPRYQPPINTGATGFVPQSDSNGNSTLPQGYLGRVAAFIDANGDGRLSNDLSEVYRAFNLSVGVLPQMSIQTGSPSVNLGNLPAGIGYAPVDPYAQKVAYGLTGSPFSPWSTLTGIGNWSDAYKPIVIRNDSNVNLLHLRVALAGNNQPGGTYKLGDNQPWPIYSADSDPNAWLGGSLRDGNGNLLPGSLWSNIDSTFAAPYSGRNDVILPKPRVTDRVAQDLVANPYPRANPNTGATGRGGAANALNKTLSPDTPRVAVSVPIGFPVGNYSSQIRVFEDLLDYGGNADGFTDSVLNFFPGLQTSEAYSDPINLSFKVRETRMTNTTTPRTAPVIDPDLLPAGGPSVYAYKNTAPAAMRSDNGDVVVVYQSNRPTASPSVPVDSTSIGPNRLFFATMQSNGTKSTDPAPGYNPPLWDLYQFDATGSSWFKKPTANASGYPANPGSYFKDNANDTVNDKFVSFGSPSLPVASTINPLNAGQTFNNGTLMAFVGNAEVQTQTGRVTRSRVFISTLTGRGTTLSPSAPIATLDDPLTAKGKPSIVQLDGSALLFYPVTSAGQTGINVSRYTTAFGPVVPLGFGDGFSSVSSPSASVRNFQDNANTPILELSFAGKLRGRPNAEVYLGRMVLGQPGGKLGIVDSKGVGIDTPGAGSGFTLLPTQVNERLLADGAGTFRSRGVTWSRTAGIDLKQTISGSLVSILVGKGTIDRQSGLVAYDTRMGGKVYFDPELGTVRFAGATPSVNAELRLTYRPTFLRVTPGGTAGYSAVNGMFDGRNASERDYWFAGNAVNSYGNTTNEVLHNDRLFFAYGRGAAGGGVTARPYSTTMRFGIRLPTRVATDADGKIVYVRVIGNRKPYQVDPANGRIYFQAEDENAAINVEYKGVNEGTNAPVDEVASTNSVSYVLERDEALIPVDEASNDSAITAFLDPFTDPNVARPPLVWLFYVSTRGGSPDVYFQTIAPRLAPFAK